MIQREPYKMPRVLCVGRLWDLAMHQHYGEAEFSLEEAAVLLRAAANLAIEQPRFATALRWLADNGRWPLSLDYGEISRWYPASGKNEDGRFVNTGTAFFADCEHCLLPEAVYYAMRFPKPAGYSGPRYPWFSPFEAGIEAAVMAVVEVGT